MMRAAGTAVVLVALTLSGRCARADEGDGAGRALNMYAAVFTVQGSVVGRSMGGYGAFAREKADTTWRMLNMSNAFTYGLGFFADSTSHRYYIAAGNGLQRSMVGGRSWTMLTSWRTGEILGLAVDPVDSATLYVATPEWVYKTTDAGHTWTPKKDGFKRWYIQRLIMDPSDRKRLFAAGEDDVYRTGDGGEHWVPLRTGISQIQGLFQGLSDRRRLLCSGENAGIRVSADGGVHWRKAVGLDSATLYAFAESPGGHILYAAGWRTGVWTSTDGGGTWSLLWSDTAIEAIFSIAIDPANARHLCVGTDGQGVYESFDAGRTWARAGLMGGKVKEIGFYP